MVVGGGDVRVVVVRDWSVGVVALGSPALAEQPATDESPSADAWKNRRRRIAAGSASESSNVFG